MASGRTTYLKNKILDAELGGVVYTAPATVYIGLFTDVALTDHAAGTGTEPSGNGYARVAVTNNATNFPAAASGSKSNANQINLPTPSGSWGTCYQVGVWDALSSGNLLYWADLGAARLVTSGDTPNIPANQLTLTA